MYYYGVVICIASGVFTSVGLCLQKISQKMRSERSESSHPYTEYFYILGLICVLLGQMLRMITDGILPQSTGCFEIALPFVLLSENFIYT